MVENSWIISKTKSLLDERVPILDQAVLENYVKYFLDRRDKFLNIEEHPESPLYLIDIDGLQESLIRFSRALNAEIPNNRIYFAVKSCNNRSVVQYLINQGCGIDVSSGMELEMALDLNARRLIFSGPGKTDDELRLAVDNCQLVTVLIDSFGELERLNAIAAKSDVIVRAGIRLTTQEDGLWRKFGIPLNALNRFFKNAEQCKHINLCGLQFHTSWNRGPEAQCNFIKRLGEQLEDFPDKYKSQIEFLDIGGGYWPSMGEWLQPEGTTPGQLRKIIMEKTEPVLTHYCYPATKIETFFAELKACLSENIPGQIRSNIYVEPGRWLANNALHILLTVVDKKARDIVITDGGINMVGWERYETDYFPVINLSRPEINERMCYIFGSLCTPHDIWGYSYFGEEIQVGDKLLIPSQGAYTYSLRQEFIKPIPKMAILATNHSNENKNIISQMLKSRNA